MSNTKGRIEKLEAGISELEVVNKKLKELDTQNKRIKEKQLQLLTSQIENKKKEIARIRQPRVPRYRGNLIPKGHKLKSPDGTEIDRVD